MATLYTTQRYDGSVYIRGLINYSTSQSNTTVTVTVSNLQEYNDAGGWDNDGWEFGYYTTNTGSQGNLSYTWNPGGYHCFDGGTTTIYGTAKSQTFARKTSAYTVTLYVRFRTYNGGWSGYYTGSVNISVPALASYAVTFNGNGNTGGSTSKQTKYYGVNLTLNANGFTKTGYEFIGWNTSNTATSASYGNQATYSGNAALTLYAIWRKTITVTYNANGGEGAPSASTGYAYNSNTSVSITLSNTIPTRTSYIFDGWSTTAGGAKSYEASTAYTFSDSLIIYARWITTGYSIIYNLDGGSLPSGNSNPSTYNIETNTFKLNNPIKSGYKFAGWTGSNGTVPNKCVVIPKGSTGNKNYTANWESINYKALDVYRNTSTSTYCLTFGGNDETTSNQISSYLPIKLEGNIYLIDTNLEIVATNLGWSDVIV